MGEESVASGSGSEGGVAISESSIQQIVSLGFSRQQAMAELRGTGGNVELATALLLAKSISSSMKK